MDNLLLDKPERRRILGQIENWNFGIAPNGNLAQEPSFVHHAVPDIFREISDDMNTTTITTLTAIDGYLPIITRSEWTENLIQSGVSNPNDAATVKSLAICSSIFRDNIEFANLKSKQKPKIHYTSATTNAYVKLDNIARLTTEFENEIVKAQEHWPRNPQGSWDKLCQIWTKYGFLWPEKLHLGYKYNYDELMKSKEHISQDQAKQRGPQTYTIVWRTNLRPIYEFFPETHADKKAFIVDIIRHISSLIVFNSSLFKIKNMRTNQYLGRHQQQSITAADDDNDAVVMVSDENTNDTNEHSLWKFQDTGLLHSNELSYVFLGTNLFLCSDHDESSFLTKQGPFLTPKGIVKTYHQKPDDSLSWRINPSKYSIKTGKKAGAFHIDDVIASLVCLKDGDDIILSQNSYYLRTDTDLFTPLTPFPSISNNNSPMNTISSGMLKKSPISLMSIDGRYNFSSAERSESNSTQPTCNSLSSQHLGKNNINNIRRSSITSQSFFNTTDVYIEKLEDNETKFTSKDYQWKIELVTAKDTIFENPIKHTKFTDKLPTNAMPSKENDTSIPANTEKKDENKINQDFAISSFVPTRELHHIPKESPRISTPFIDKPQKSQWLDGNTKLYNLQKDSDESDVSIVIAEIDLRMDSNSRYSTPIGSLKSIPSNEEIIAPPVLSAKKIGKLPLQSLQAQQHQQRYQNSSPPSSNGDSDWTASPTPSISKSLTPVPKKMTEIRNVTATPEITEAEAFKRKVQQNFEDKEEAYASIYRNIFARSTPTSNTTSQIKYYDDEYDHPVTQGSSSVQVRPYTMTPKSRNSQPTPTSSANLTSEEYLLRKRSRETSFMLLVRQETKQQLWVRAMKQSTLSHWLQSITSNSKKSQHQANQQEQQEQQQQHNIMVLPTNGNKNATAPNSALRTSTGDIRLQYHSKSNRTIKKKKGFYQKNSFRRQKGIII